MYAYENVKTCISNHNLLFYKVFNFKVLCSGVSPNRLYRPIKLGVLQELSRLIAMKGSVLVSEARTVGETDRTCTLLQAINYNGLLFFTIANLMTGAVNLSVDTQSFAPGPAFVIVTTYMLILSVIFLNLYNKKFSFKAYLWRSKQSRPETRSGQI